MFGLVRFVFSLAITAIVVWFAVSVPLGKKTLWGHLRAIGGTEAAHELAEGTAAEARKVADKILGGHDGGAPDLTPARPLDPVDEHDRQALDKLVKKKAGKK